ncbi:FtsX-like permease family protein [Ornithinimicrobium sp. F0845]|uniref:ABC transporter permease n=1 Tax=Ornithinimicrobium sp. F0845 TaxID=2926412 RepID=UPI001FF18F8A|nr:FtsX-like permease family protein [Ornithinimicrobium sp. F0845]MCK0112821.1 FtsX-like permease family protein [Ornithinimicrobium sp. F0845]
MRTGGLALAGLRGHARRLGATALAIMLSVAFVATTMLALDAMERGVGEAVAGDVVHRDLVLLPTEGSVGFAELDELRGADGLVVEQVGAEVLGTTDGEPAMATTAPRGPGVELVEGVLPEHPGQVAVPPESGLDVGDEVAFERYLVEGDSAAVEPLSVVGILDVGNSPRFTWQDVLVVDESQLRTWEPDLTLTLVTLDVAGADEATARATIESIVPGVEVLTGTEAADLLVSQATGGLDVLGPVLLGFGAVAVATSALVIANTFAIVLAQRTRELALLRCVGATRSQVRRTVLTEAGLLGVAAATAGVLFAVGLTWTTASLLGEVNLGTPITLRPGLEAVSLLVPWAVGVAVTLTAAWWPTRRATRIAPMAALQPASAPAVASRPGLVRIVLSVLLLGAGGAGLVLAATSHDVVIGVAAGLLSFVGVLVAAVFFVPAGIRALGSVLRGTPSRLAVGNSVANPARAAATSAALLIGVTLITMTSVGAASAERTAEDEIDRQYPADVMVFPSFELTGNPSDEPTGTSSDEPSGNSADELSGTSSDEPSGNPFDASGERMVAQPLDRSLTATVAALDGVAVSVPFRAGWLELEAPDGSWQIEGPAYGLDPVAVAPALRDATAVQALSPGTIGLPEDYLEGSPLQEGDTVTVNGPDGSREATIVTLGLGEIVLPVDDLAALDAQAVEAGMLIRLTDDADIGGVVADIRQAVDNGAWVDGGAAARQELSNALDILVLVTTGLLAVAVLIAVVGIANTLALSVLERTRENALLRALGLTRSQLRGMLTVEGVLLAVVSALLGIGLGVTYAWFGVRTLIPDGTGTVLAFPLTELVVILTVAVAAGLLASVLPARRAARTAPAAGLAAV